MCSICLLHLRYQHSGHLDAESFDGSTFETSASTRTASAVSRRPRDTVKALRARDPKPGAEYNVSVLILKAKDAQGQPLFQWGDKHALMHSCDYLTIIRLVNEMSRTLTPEDAKKNWPGTPTSTSA